MCSRARTGGGIGRTGEGDVPRVATGGRGGEGQGMIRVSTEMERERVETEDEIDLVKVSDSCHSR